MSMRMRMMMMMMMMMMVIRKGSYQSMVMFYSISGDVQNVQFSDSNEVHPMAGTTYVM